MGEAGHACIYCGSRDLVFTDDKQGFGAGKAVVGALVFGPLGLLAGAAGRNKRHVSIRCNSCLKYFTGDQLRSISSSSPSAASGCLTVIGAGLILVFVFAVSAAMCSPRSSAPRSDTTSPSAAPIAAPDMARPAKKHHKKAKPSAEEP